MNGKRTVKKISADALLDIMVSYLRQISRHGEEFTTVVLGYIKASIESVLKRSGYSGRYVTELEDKGEY